MPRFALVLVLLATTLALAGCGPGDTTWLACVFGDHAACDALTNPPPPPPPPVPGPPAAPTGLTATIVAGGVSLDWNDNTESDLDHYTVYRGTYDAGHQGGVAYTSLGAADRSDFLDSVALVDGSTYFYAVTALDTGSNESERSAPVSRFYCAVGHTCHEVPGPPAAPTGLVPVLQDAAGLVLDWNDNTEPDLYRYLVYRTTTAGSYGQPLFFVGRDSSTATVDAATYGLEPFSTYLFTVTAVDDDGDGLESARSNEIRVRFCPATLSDCPVSIGPVTGLRLVSREAGGVSVAWDATPGANVARYAVYRATGPLHAQLLGTTTGTSFTDHAPGDGFPNHYTVAAVDRDGHQGARSPQLDVDWCGASDPTCSGTGAPARHVHPLAARRLPAAFKLTLSAAVTQEGARTLDGVGRLVARGDAISGTFELRAAPDGLDPALRRLVAKPLAGTWTGTADWTIDPGTQSGTSTATGLATFADPALGTACLRLSDTFATQRVGKRPPKLVTHGASTLLGGTGPGPRLFGDATYTRKLRRDGTLVYKGTTDRSRTVTASC